MHNVMAAQQHIGGALCEIFVIPFQVPCYKVWLTPLLECRAVTLPIQENARFGRKINFALGKIPSGGKSPENVYIMYQPWRWPNIVQFGWPLVSDVAAVTKARHEIR